jgi:hypothetical protein
MTILQSGNKFQVGLLRKAEMYLPYVTVAYVDVGTMVRQL